MDQPRRLTAAQADAALRILRAGDTATAAARFAQVKPAAIYEEARENPDFRLALAGHDPWAPESIGVLQRAEYIYYLALGYTPTQAARVLFHGDSGTVNKWRVLRPEFAIASDTAARTHPPVVRRRREHRFTPHRIRIFLNALKKGMPCNHAAEEAGVTQAVIYQTRRRDPGFRELMDAARREGGTGGRAPWQPVTQQQWKEFFVHLEEGQSIRQAALAAGIAPTNVYKRRGRDVEFRARTNPYLFQR